MFFDLPEFKSIKPAYRFIYRLIRTTWNKQQDFRYYRELFFYKSGRDKFDRYNSKMTIAFQGTIEDSKKILGYLIPSALEQIYKMSYKKIKECVKTNAHDIGNDTYVSK